LKIARVLPPKENGVFERLLAGLRKSYPSVDADFARECEILTSASGPPVPCGTRVTIVIGFAGKVVKVRVPSEDQKSGRSGGFRVLMYRVENWDWQPIMIWAKSKLSDATAKDVRRAINEDTKA